MTRRKVFSSKSCLLILHFTFLLHCYQSVTDNKFMTFCWKIFLPVCGMCLSHNWYNLFAYCILYGTWILDGCDDYIICTTNWYIQIPLDFKKWLIYKDFILKDTRLLSSKPWPSMKQSTILIKSNSNLVFLTFSILSANTEPLVCVVFVFWKELNKCFLYFFLKSFFLQCSAFCPIPCFSD